MMKSKRLQVWQMLFVCAIHANKYFRWRRMQLNTARFTHTISTYYAEDLAVTSYLTHAQY